jgi:hypothetical protein
MKIVTLRLIRGKWKKDEFIKFIKGLKTIKSGMTRSNLFVDALFDARELAQCVDIKKLEDDEKAILLEYMDCKSKEYINFRKYKKKEKYEKFYELI